MTVELNREAIDRVAALPAVREAAETGARLIALWPLTEAMQMDNDAKYAENLQVRITRAFARILTGEDVTVPDAEFVYEGADEIPGRPQSIVDTLLAANDAYDAMADFSETGDAALVDDAAQAMGVAWDDAVAVRVHEVLESVEAALDEGMFDSTAYTAGTGSSSAAASPTVPAAPPAPAAPVTSVTPDGGDRTESVPAPSDDDFRPSGALIEAVAHRFAVALIVCDALLDAVADDSGAVLVDAATPVDDAAVRAVLPLLLALNELHEQITVPRIHLADVQIRDLLAARADALVAAVAKGVDENVAVLDATAALIAPLAGAEWAKHREDVLWDPAEAKKKAKEEDEKRNKEALAAKFAHIKDDPTKETVEL